MTPKAIRILRIALPIAFVGFIALLVASYRSTRREAGAPGEAVNSHIRVGDKAESVAYAFDDTQTLGGRVVSRIRARRTIGFSSGWYTLEDAELTIFRKNGQAYILTCPEIQFHAATKKTEAAGGVRVHSSDGVEIVTESIRFDGNRLENRIPIRFTIDALSGRAGGVDLDVSQDVVRLVDGVEGTMQSAAQSPPAAFETGEVVFYRARSEVILEKNPILTRARDRLSTERIVARFDPKNRKRLTALDGCCRLSMDLSSAAGAQQSSRPAQTKITSDRFYSEITPAGEIAAITFMSDQGRTHATTLTAPRRELFGKQFRVVFSGGAARELQVHDQVQLRESALPLRIAEAEHLNVTLDAATGEPSVAILQENVRYRDGTTEATSQRVHYDIAGDKLLLTSRPGMAPSVVSDGNAITSTRIELDQRTRVVRGIGNVAAKLSSTSSASASGSSVFPGGRAPVYVNSESLVIREAEGVAAFSGKVRAWQENNVLFAQELQLTGRGEAMQARGGVRMILYNAQGETPKVPVLARSQALAATKAERRLELDGKVAIDDAGRSLTADHASLFFDAARKLERIEARDNVQLVDAATHRKGSGTTGVYELKQRTVQITGSPAVMSEPRGSIKGEQILLDLARNKVDVVSGEKPTEATYNPQ